MTLSSSNAITRKPRKRWDLSQFAKINLPEVIHTDIRRGEFSRNNGIRVLDMPFMMPGQGIKIHPIVKQFEDVIWTALMNEDKYVNPHRLYGYITVDQKTVKAGKTQRRAGAHSDAYLERYGVQVDVTDKNADLLADETGEVSHTYLIYDTLPTEFFMCGFPLDTTDCSEAMKTFDEVAAFAEEHGLIVRYPSYRLLKLDPYVVHRSPVALEDTERTFVKISFSTKRYNREGNTKNALFDYNWQMEPRTETRNHPWSSDQVPALVAA